MYCFTALRYIGAKKSNKNLKRNTGHGTWKSTGTRRRIHDCTGAVVGSKLHLSYYAKGCTTASNWIMHEFRLPNSSKGDDLILCRIKGPSPTASAPPPPLTDTSHPCPRSPFLFSEDEPPADSDLRGLGLDPQLDGLGGGGGDYYLNATTATPEPLFPHPQFELDLELPQLLPAPQMELGEGVCEGSDEDFLAGLADDIEDKLLQDNDDDEATSAATMAEQPPPHEEGLGGGVCEGDEDSLAGLADFIEDKLLQDNTYDEATSAETMAEQPPPQEEDEGEGEYANRCSLPLLSPQSQPRLQMQQYLQDCNPSAAAATTVEQQGPLPTWDMWAGDWDSTTDCFTFDNLDQVYFMEQVQQEEEQHQEEHQGRAGEPNSSSSANSKQPGEGGDGSSASAITPPHLHHESGHLGPEEANASKRRRSLTRSASPNSRRCIPPQAKRPRPCPIQW